MQRYLLALLYNLQFFQCYKNCAVSVAICSLNCSFFFFFFSFYQEMGFPQSQSEAAIQAYGTVQAALEALLAGKGEGMNE